MIERPSFENKTPENGFSEIVSDISNISRSIKELYDLRDVRYLTNDEYSEVRRLHHLKNDRLIDLLLQKREKGNSSINIVMKKFPGEEMHLFSMNHVSIYVPSREWPDSQYFIKAELSDIRRTGVSENSLQAEHLLGEKTQEVENTASFVQRTAKELTKINRLKQEAGKPEEEGSAVFEYLDQLSADLISKRLIMLRFSGRLPEWYSVYFYLQEGKKGKKNREVTKIIDNGYNRKRDYIFITQGQKLEPVLETLGGYDNL